MPDLELSAMVEELDDEVSAMVIGTNMVENHLVWCGERGPKAEI
ncbi:hypothetical protein OROGR_019176 [Orobanche gracilis]